MVALGVGGAVTATQARAASTRPAAPGLSISKQFFGFAFNKYAGHNLPVFRWTLRNNRGMKVQIITYGAIVQDIWAPDRNGVPADVVLGFKTLADYVEFDSPQVAPTTGVYFGETVGRYANRIANGKFTLSQPGVGPVNYTIPVNNQPTPCTAGSSAPATASTAGQPVFGFGSVGVRLTLISPNGDEGYPAGSPGCPSGCTGYPATIRVVVTYPGGTDNLDPQNPMPVNLAFFLNYREVPKPLFALAGSVDIGVVWCVILLGLGMSKATGGKVKALPITLCFVGAWAIWIIGKVALAAIF